MWLHVRSEVRVDLPEELQTRIDRDLQAAGLAYVIELRGTAQIVRDADGLTVTGLESGRWNDVGSFAAKLAAD